MDLGVWQDPTDAILPRNRTSEVFIDSMGCRVRFGASTIASALEEFKPGGYVLQSAGSGNIHISSLLEQDIMFCTYSSQAKQIFIQNHTSACNRKRYVIRNLYRRKP